MEREKLRGFITYEDCDQFMISIFFSKCLFLLDVLKIVYLSPVFLSFLIKKKKLNDVSTSETLR